MTDIRANRTQLEYAIVNVINAYRNIGGRRVTAENLPLAFNRLYTAIEALDTQYAHAEATPTSKPDIEPPCGGHICDCQKYGYSHFHEPTCTCWDDYALTNPQNGAHA